MRVNLTTLLLPGGRLLQYTECEFLLVALPSLTLQPVKLVPQVYLGFGKLLFVHFYCFLFVLLAKTSLKNSLKNGLNNLV